MTDGSGGWLLFFGMLIGLYFMSRRHVTINNTLAPHAEAHSDGGGSAAGGGGSLHLVGSLIKWGVVLAAVAGVALAAIAAIGNVVSSVTGVIGQIGAPPITAPVPAIVVTVIPPASSAPIVVTVNAPPAAPPIVIHDAVPVQDTTPLTVIALSTIGVTALALTAIARSDRTRRSGEQAQLASQFFKKDAEVKQRR